MEVEIPFVLPRGYLDATGQVHRDGSMRMATALDEIETVQNPRVLANEAYLPVALLSRVITRLGSLPAVSPSIMEQFFVADLAYLEDLYLRLNSFEKVDIATTCPHCDKSFQLQIAPLEV